MKVSDLVEISDGYIDIRTVSAQGKYIDDFVLKDGYGVNLDLLEDFGDYRVQSFWADYERDGRHFEEIERVFVTLEIIVEED